MDWWEGAGALEGQPAQQGRAPKVWLAKVEGLDSVSSDSQQDLTSGTLKSTILLRGREGERTLGGRGVEPRKTELSLAGNKGTDRCHLPLPSPSRNSKGNQFPSLNLLALHKGPMLCFCGSIPPMGLPPSWCCRAPPQRTTN